MTQQEVISDIELRARAIGLNIQELCERAKVHPTSFSRWKRSARNPCPSSASMNKIEALYRVLGELETKAA